MDHFGAQEELTHWTFGFLRTLAGPESSSGLPERHSQKGP
jgi:hypothetical protein